MSNLLFHRYQHTDLHKAYNPKEGWQYPAYAQEPYQVIRTTTTGAAYMAVHEIKMHREFGYTVLTIIGDNGYYPLMRVYE